MWAMIKEGYEGLVMTVIRPMRALYALEDLGPKHALINDVVTHRLDMQLKNEGGYALQCSWWKPSTTEKGCVLSSSCPMLEMKCSRLTMLYC